MLIILSPSDVSTRGKSDAPDADHKAERVVEKKSCGRRQRREARLRGHVQRPADGRLERPVASAQVAAAVRFRIVHSECTVLYNAVVEILYRVEYSKLIYSGVYW